MKRTKKVALWDPYLDTLGGGEKHILSILKAFAEQGFEVELLWDDKAILNDLEDRFNLGLSRFRVMPNFLNDTSFFSKIQKTKEYDYLFYMTDGSYFISRAGHSYVFAMVPKRDLYIGSLANQVKRRFFSFISNSHFTESWIKKWGIASEVIYPYVESDFFQTKHKKEKIILSVGRFFDRLHSKKQSEIITMFNKLKRQLKLLNEFKLYLVGGLKGEDKKYYAQVKELIQKRTDIILLPNLERQRLLHLYQKASIYWHFAGIGVDEKSHPESVEHLGISILEAMASGCVTFAYAAGGPKELISDEQNGYLFDNRAQLVQKMSNLLKSPKLQDTISANASKHVKDNFSYEKFNERVTEIFSL